MTSSELQRLEKINERIQGVAREFGLSIVPVDFEVIPAQKMFEIMAYRFPVNFSHWSRGKDYERQRTIYEHSGRGLPYELVLNSSPPRAFIMETNPFPVQVLVLAHVYGHVDFFLENQHMLVAPKDILVSAYEAARRFRQYEEKYGLSRVEPVIDAALTIEPNIDPDAFIKKESREEAIRRLFDIGAAEPCGKKDSFRELFPGRKKKKRRLSSRELAHKTPLEPDRDLIGYVMQNSPKPLQDWEADILSTVRSQFAYFYPQMRTKMVNEGWAAYWHTRIMRRLFEEKLLTPKEHGFYSRYHANITARSKVSLNPYLVGMKIFEDVKDRWNKGKFGKEWSECEDLWEREHWDKKLGAGRDKIFEIRRVYTDRMFIEHFLTDELIRELDLFIYEGVSDPETGETTYIIVEKNPRVIRQILKTFHADMGIPRIMVEDGNYGGTRELYLRHYCEGAFLDSEYMLKTIEHIFALWGRTVHLETVEMVEESKIAKFVRMVYSFDGVRHKKESQGRIHPRWFRRKDWLI